ncbi:MAG: GTPase Era [Pseudomonadota bacterium]
MSGPEPVSETKAGIVALIGAPNAGKSTLMNQLVGSKISIVTHKVQTTRAVMRGIATHENCQIVFVDTPGIFAPRRHLDRAMVTTAWSNAKDADISVLLIDAERGVTEDIERIVKNLNTVSGTVVLLLNKIDRVQRDGLLALTSRLNELYAFDETFMLSALNGDGCDSFMDYLAKSLPPGPFLYPDDQLSDLPMRVLAAEITREKLYLRLHQELPYASHVETESWEEKKDGSIKISQVIYVERDGHKKILIGKKGATIKAISTAARKEISELVEAPAHLFLFVKVRENWGTDPERYRAMGLEFPNG